MKSESEDQSVANSAAAINFIEDMDLSMILLITNVDNSLKAKSLHHQLSRLGLFKIAFARFLISLHLRFYRLPNIYM